MVQILLAIVFGLAGYFKISAPIEKLSQMGMSFVTSYPEIMVRLIGVAEVLGAIGLILPSAMRIKPVLTPVAAVGFSIIMVLATWQHISDQESFVSTLILLALCCFVAWARFQRFRIPEKIEIL